MKARILQEARAILLSEGYTTLSMRRIAQAIPCTATSIYLYFRDKDDLIHALIDEGMTRLCAELTAGAPAGLDAAARLRLCCRRYLEFGLRNPEYYELMFMLHQKHMQRYPAEKYRRARRNFEVLAEGLAAAAGRAAAPIDAELELCATALWSSLHGATALLIANRIDTGVDAASLVGEIVDVATRGALGRLAGTGPQPGAREASR